MLIVIRGAMDMMSACKCPYITDPGEHYDSKTYNCTSLSQTQEASPECRFKKIVIYVCHYYILRFHVTSPILGERIAAILIPQQCKQWYL